MPGIPQSMRRWWPGRTRSGPERRLDVRPVAEALEPRILYSADLAPVLLSGSAAGSPEQRSLTDSGEYAAGTAATQEQQVVGPAGSQAEQAVDTAAVAARYASVPLSFEANAGQAAAGSDFIAQGNGYGISLEGGSAVLTLGVDANAQTLRLTLEGANADPVAQGRHLLAATTNYLVGSDPAAWHTGIANYGDVVYQGVYDGIDLRYYGNQGQLEYDFIVGAGSDAGEIRLRFDGALSVAIAASGDLVLTLDAQGGQVSFKAPVSWQDGPGGREAVASSYVIHADGSIGFALGAYDATRTLVIDPVLNYASYFGTSGTESGLGVAVDAGGAVYITGRTTNSLPVNLGGGGGGDVYVAKFSADLSTLIYSTRVGGTGDEQGNAIAVDGTGAASVTGWTRSTNFPSASGSRSGSQDAFVFRLNAAGSALTFATYLGGVGATDSGNGIAVDAAGNLYVVGQRTQGLIPITIGLGGLGVLGGDDAFITKFNSAGVVQYSGLVGGSGIDYATGVAVDSSGNAYLVGNTTSNNLPMVNANDTTRQGDEGFLVKVNPAGDSILYSTYIGGSKQDSVAAVAVGAGGMAYVTGTTDARNSGEFQITAGAFQAANPGDRSSGFVRVYNTALSGAASLTYSTFLGGTDNKGSSDGDFPTGIAVDSGGRIIVIGNTDTEDFPTTPDAHDSNNDDENSMFLVVIDPAGAGASDLVYGTFFGTVNDSGGVVVSGGRAVMVATSSTSGLATSGSAQPTRAGGSDALVVGFTIVNSAPVLSGANDLAAIFEDALTNNGTLVSALISGRVTDSDFGPLSGIAVTGVNNSNGTWQYSLNGGSGWSSFGSPSDAVARLLAADALTRIRFVPNANFAGTVAGGLTFRAWDRTTGTAGSTANTTTSGGSTAYSSASASAGISVTAVNDAPQLAGGTVASRTVTEDSGLTSLGFGSLVYATGGGADEAGQTLTYTVNTVPAPGMGNIVLADGLTLVGAGSSWTLADLQGMQFRTAPDASGGPLTFSWTVRDDGGTASGGADSLAQSLTITVTPVNDAPVLTGANNLNGLVEDAGTNNGTLVSALISGRVSDADAGSLTGIAVTGVDNSNGVWQYSRDGGFNWTSFGSPSDANARLLDADAFNRVRFVPNANFSGTVAGLTFRAWDDPSANDGTTANTTVNGGSSIFSAAAFTAGITVSPVNDAPVRTAGSTANLSVVEDAPATSLGLGTLAYGTGGGADEAATQTLSYIVTAVPAASLGQVVLADGVTVVSAGTYMLAELQGMQFRAAANASGGPATFSWTVQDDGGTAGGGSNSLAQSLTVTVTPLNDAPVLAGANALTPVSEGSSGGAGTLVSALIAGQASDADAGALRGIAVVAVDNSNGTWQYSLNGGSNWNAFGSPSATSARLLAANGSTLVRFVPNANFAGTAASGISFRAWDQTSGMAGFTANVSVNGNATAFSAELATASITVTAVNDAPVRTAGSVANLTVAEDAGVATLGLGGVLYSPGGGADEAGQLLTYTVSAVPAASLGQVVLANGTTVVTAGASYSLADLQGMQFRAAADAAGVGSFSWTVRDDGGTAGGGADSLAQTLSITVTAVNDAPVRSAGTVANLALLEDSGTTSLGLAGLAYVPGGGADENTQLLTYRVTAVPAASLGQIVLANGTTVVTANTNYTFAQLQGMQFRAAANANGGPAAFSWTVQDNGGTAGGGANTLAESLNISVAPVNDAPVLTAGTVTNLTLAEEAAATSLGLGGLAWGPGGGADEAGQTLGYTITAVPAASLGQVVLADGTTPVTASTSYTLAQLQGMKFKAAPDANGAGSFSWTVQDSGGTAQGGADSLSHSLTITVNAVNDAPVLTGGTVSNLVVAEDSGTTSLGLAGVAYGPGGGADEAAQALTYTVTAIPSAGLGDIVLANGTTVVAVNTSYSLAQLQGMQFRAAAHANGTAAFSWSVTDSGGTALGGVNMLAQTLSVSISPVNDAPVRTAGSTSNLTVAEDSGATSLGLGTLSYGPGGGAAETGQALSYVVTAVPAAGLGNIVLADGTTVVMANTAYSLLQLHGMQFRAAGNANGGPATFSWNVVDDGGVANGGANTLSESLTVTVNAVNDAPVRTAGSVANLSVLESSGTTGLGLTGLAYGVGGGPDEAAQQVAYTVTAVPPSSLGDVVLADGTTVVTANTSYTLAQLQGMQFRAASSPVTGAADFTWSVQDDGGIALGGVDTLVQTLRITVGAVNDAPVRTAGTVADLAVVEDSGTTSLGLTGLAYGPGGGPDEAGQVLAYTVTAVPAASLGQVVLANGTTVVTANTVYTLAQLQGMQFKAAANASGGPATFSWTVMDDGGTAVGGVDTLAESLSISVAGINDAPVRTAGATNNLTVPEDSGTTSLGLGGLGYGKGGGTDEAAQTLSYTVTAIPAASLGVIVLADGTTAVTASTVYSLAQLQGMQFKAAANANGGPATFSWTVQDDGGTALGGVDTLAESLTISVAGINDAPVRTAGVTNNLMVAEDSGTTSLGLGGLGYGTGGGPDEAAQTLSYTVTAVPAASLGQIVLADGTTVVTASSTYTLGQLQGMQFKAAANANGGPATFSWTVQDNGGVLLGGVDTLTESLTVSVTGINDAPVRTAGTTNNLAVAEDSGTTSLGLTALSYSTGGGADEAAQTLSYTVTAVPAASLGQIVLADGTTVVTASSTYTLAQLQGMQFKAAANANGGPATFSWTVQDDGGTALGGVDTLAESLTISVAGINDAPVRTAGSTNNLAVAEDSGTTSLGLTALSYSTGGGADEAAQTLSYTVTAVPAASLGQIVLADGTTVVAASSTYTLAQLQGMQFKAAANASGGPATFSWTVRDNGGVLLGGVDTLNESLTVSVTGVNDAPVRTAGTTNNLAVAEDSGTTSLGLTALSYSTGGGADEAAQTLSYTVTAVPAASLGQIVLADGTTVVTASSTYTLAQLQGMQFKAAANASGGPATFSWTVQDNGGVLLGGVDTLNESLTVSVTGINDAPVRTAGTTNNLTVSEDSGTTSLGLGGLAYGTGGGSDEASQVLGFTVTAVPAAGLGQIVLADGTTVVTASSTYTLAQLQGMQFKAAANASGGPASFNWTVKDDGGTALGGVDTLVESLGITITGTNDAPVQSGGTISNLTVLEDSGTSSLGLGTLTYSTGGGSDEAAQTLSYTVTAVPAAGLGRIVLADGVTAVTANTTYTLAQLQGMQFNAAANASGGPATFSWTVQDSGGTAQGGVDTWGASLTVTVTGVNDAPELAAGAVNELAVLENSGTTGLGLGGLAYTAGGGADEAGQNLSITVTAVPAPALGHIVLADGVTVVTAGSAYSLVQLHGMQFRTAGIATIGDDWFSWTVQDDGGTANGGVDALQQVLHIVVGGVNDAPVRTAGNVDDLSVLEDSGLSSLGLGGLNGVGGLAYGPGGGSDETAQTLSYVVTAVPASSFGQIVLADGVTVVVANTAYTLAALQGMQFRAGPDAAGGPAIFSWSVQDDGGTALGGADTLVESLGISIASVNDAPVQSGGAVNNLTVPEGSGTTSLNLGGLSYSAGGGSDEAVQTLSYTVTAVPEASLGEVVLADGETAVAAGTAYSLVQLQGMQFRPAANAAGTASFSWSVSDDGGTASGGSDTVSNTLTIEVTPVDEPPVRDPEPDPEPGPPIVEEPAMPVVVAEAVPPSPPAEAQPAPVARPAPAVAEVAIAPTSGGAVLPEQGLPVEPLRSSFEARATPVAVLSAERRIEAMFDAPLAVDFSVTSFSGRGVAGSAVYEQLMRSLRAPEFTDELDRLREEIRKDFNLDKTFAVSAGGVTLGFSVLYVLWLIRGGVLMSSYLAAMPAWRVLDPLPVLSRVDDEESDDEDGLHGGAAPGGDDPVQTLRGY